MDPILQRLKSLSMEMLLDLWLETDVRKEKEINIVRDRLLTEFELRDPKAFDDWMLSSEASPDKFFNSPREIPSSL